jgi:hypothetical protein
MLKLSEKKMIVPRHLLAGQRVSRKYRLACIRRTEYRRLKAIVPSIANKQKVSKVKVVEEAIKYIDELHRALFKRAPFLAGHLSNISAPVDPLQLVARMFLVLPLPPSSAECPTSVNPSGASLPLPAATYKVRPSTFRPLQSSNYVNLSKSSS